MSEYFRPEIPLPLPHFGKGAIPDFRHLTNLVISASQGNPHVLIVENVDLTGVQVLGTTFDINPRFVAQHLETWQPHDISHQRALEVLSQKFESFKQRNEVPSHAEGDVAMATNPFSSYIMDGSLYAPITTDRAEALDLWPGSGTGRIDVTFGSPVLRPHASCYRVSPYSCKV
jgi:hypothetical protein